MSISERMPHPFERGVDIPVVRQVRKSTVKTKGPGARDGERSFGRHPSNSFTTPDTKGTEGPGARDGERSFGRHPQQLVHDPAD